MMLATRKPRLIGRRALVSLLLGPHGVDAGDRGDDADGAGAEREHEAERRVGTDGGERRDTEDDRRHEGHLVRLEEVGGHAGAVADVVADVVGDGGRVAGVVLGDAGLDLADEVGADVGRLGEDAAADAEEQGDQRSTESEADEDRRARVLEHHDDDRRAEQSEPDREHAGDAAGAEGDLEGCGERAGLGRSSGSDVAARGERHADVAGEAGQQGAGDEGEGAERARLRPRQRDGAIWLQHLGRGEEHDDRDRHHDHGDRAELTSQVGGGAFLDGQRDLDHLRGALVGREHAAHQQEPDPDRHEGDQRGQQREWSSPRCPARILDTRPRRRAGCPARALQLQAQSSSCPDQRCTRLGGTAVPAAREPSPLASRAGP